VALEPDARPFTHVTGFIWPILAIFVALVVFFIVHIARSSDHESPRRLRDSLATPLFLGAAGLVIGFAGTAVELYRALRQMALTPEQAAPLFSRTVLGTTSTLAIALLVALASGVVWFVLAGRAAKIEDEAAQTYMGVK
jgi:uncharacterized membrane protein YfcA